MKDWNECYSTTMREMIPFRLVCIKILDETGLPPGPGGFSLNVRQFLSEQIRWTKWGEKQKQNKKPCLNLVVLTLSA